MEVGLTNATMRLKRSWILFGTAMAVLFSVLMSGAPAAHAATEANTQVRANVHQESSDPSSWEYSIGGSLLLNGKGIKGVTVSAILGSEHYDATTDSSGEWTIAVPKGAEYKVEIVQSTLPKGYKPVNPVLTADLTQTSFAAVLFRFAGQPTTTQSFSDQLTIRIFAGLNFGLLLAMAAIGISLIFGTTGLSNFAHGEMVTFGALLTWLFHAVLGWGVVIAGLVAVLLTAAFGWSQDAFIWKPLRKRRMGLNQMMIVSIGLSIVFRYLLLLFFGGDTKDIADGGNIIKLGPINTTNLTLWGMLIAVVSLGGVALFLTRTRVGKATRAVSDNAALASATGIDVESIIRIVWVVAAALTGLSGVIYGLELQANWLTGFDILLLLFSAVTLGGLGTSLGATVGALIIGMVVEVSSMFIPNELKYAAALVILIIILIVRPQGVLGKKQRLG